MTEGITIDGIHSFYRHKLRLTKRSVGNAPKDDYTERVPFSNVTYDFSTLYGQSFGERTLTYQLEFICFDRKKAQDRVVAVLRWLHWKDRKNLYDDLLPDYHFEVREPEIKWSENHGVYTFDMTFRANPEIVANNGLRLKDTVLPDVNNDGFVDSVDSTMISVAYSKISTGQDSGLTAEQLRRADANSDGFVDSVDSTLVSGFYAKLATGRYSCTLEDWTEYLNDVLGKRNGVI
ncbi:MAG: hypothetical protein K2J44_09640 [Ruminococcus sp.]|nr:hypothetical protein [Ruminococcus sp.]